MTYKLCGDGMTSGPPRARALTRNNNFGDLFPYFILDIVVYKNTTSFKSG